MTSGLEVLYLTYDGLTDTIGEAQVRPYLEGCAEAGHRLTVISFEKPDRFERNGQAVRQRCEALGIDWRPQRFRSSPPLLAKWLDLRTLVRVARKAMAERRFDLVHGRSYPAAWVGQRLADTADASTIFDMRGFWADQRREGGRWSDDHPIGKRLYRQWKGREAQLLRDADHIVVLTDAARRAIMEAPDYAGKPVSVIPCCTDFDALPLPTNDDRQSARSSLGIDQDAAVLTYLGSTGTVYRIDAHFRLFDRVRARSAGARMLFVTGTPREDVLRAANAAGVAVGDRELIVRSADRDQLPGLLAVGGVGTLFLSEGFSSKGVSATKLAEYLASGLPVLANRAVGDVVPILEFTGGGHLLDDFSDQALDETADAFFQLDRDTNRADVRGRARMMLDLPIAVKAYRQLYDSMAPFRVPGEIGR